MHSFGHNLRDRVALFLVLPYIILTFTASFLHTDQPWWKMGPAACQIHLPSHGDEFSLTHLTAQDKSDDADCPACSWLSLGTSVTQIAHLPVLATKISPLVERCISIYDFDPRLLTSSRAPPQV